MKHADFDDIFGQALGAEGGGHRHREEFEECKFKFHNIITLFSGFSRFGMNDFGYVLEEIADTCACEHAVVMLAERVRKGRMVVTNLRLELDVRHRPDVQGKGNASKILAGDAGREAQRVA